MKAIGYCYRMATMLSFSVMLALGAYTAWACEPPTSSSCQCDAGCGCDPPSCPAKLCENTACGPVRYLDGEIIMRTNDLGGEGLLGHSRFYSNREANDDHGQGYGWYVEQWPSIAPEGGNMMVLFRPSKSYWFAPKAGGYATLYGAHQKLDKVGNAYRMTDPDGTVWEFFDLQQSGSPSTLPSGLFKRRVSPGGQTVEVTRTTATRITQVQITNPNTAQPFEQYDYTYGTGSADNNRLTSVRLSRWNGTAMVPVRQTNYVYYGDNDPCGSRGDLRTATTYYAFNAGNQPTGDSDTYYYRYYTGSSIKEFNHGLKYIFFPQTYKNLTAYLGRPPLSSDSDATVSPYACYYFEYDSIWRVAREVLFGKSQEFTFEYTERGVDESPNVWKTKTVEKQINAGGGPVYTKTVYTNGIAQVLLADLKDANNKHWVSYLYYDNNYRLLLQAEPSAVSGYGTTGSDTWNGAVPTFTADGLVRETSYYAATTATATTPGGAEGYPAYNLLRKAQYYPMPIFSTYTAPGLAVNGSTTAVLTYQQYFTHTGGSTTIYPVAALTVFTDPDGSATSALTATYAYTWHPTRPLQVQQQTTTLPAVTANQNNQTGNADGAGGITQRQDYYDAAGRLTFSRDERGRITANIYDPITGLSTQTIRDASTAGATGWAVPSDALNLVTDFMYDYKGRIIQTLGPAFTDNQGNSVRTAGWTVYDDAEHMTYSAQGWRADNGTTTGAATMVYPVLIQKYNADGRLMESIQSAIGTSPTVSDSLLDFDATALAALNTQSNYTRWTANHYKNMRLVETAIYFDIPSSGTTNNTTFAGSASTAGTDGVATGNYNLIRTGYQNFGDATNLRKGRQNKITSPGGTITCNVLDVWGRVIETWVGTNDTGATDANPGGASPNNMTRTASYVYDQNTAPLGGDGNLTQITQYVDNTATRTVRYNYDWRNRQTTAITSDNTNTYITQNTLDNLGRTIRTDKFYNTTGGSTGTLIARNETSYDNRGRAYQSRAYGVDIATGNTTGVLIGNTWYDPAGNVLMTKRAGSGTAAFTKMAYDGLNRRITTYSGYTPGGGVSPTLDSAVDLVFSQTETTYDPADNIIFTITRNRLADAPATPGPLSVLLARSSYAATWYDGLTRITDSANYGINNGIPMTAANRPATPPTSTPSVLVNAILYNARGEAYQTIDPAGCIDQQTLDNAARLVSTVKNVIPNGTAFDQNITVLTAYTPDSQIATLTAVNPTTGNQVTKYAYGTSLATDTIARTDLLKGVIYPSSTNTFTISGGVPVFTGTYNRVEYTYNRQSERTTTKDENSTIHAYAYDGIGRLIADTITASGVGVSSTVQKIARAYEPRGILERITSYSNSSGTTVANDVLHQYDSFSRLIAEYQSRSALATTGSPGVTYTYTNSSGNVSRPTSLTYPSGRQIAFNYASGAADAFNHVSSFSDNVGTLAQFSYLGLDRIVKETYPTPNLTLDYTTAGALDNFNRIADHAWKAGSTDIVHIQHTYDLAGNRLTRNDTLAVSAGLSETYNYDGVNQLISLARPNGSSEDFTYDTTGNWTQYQTEILTQTRTHNQANEITSITGTPSITHDQVGNMLSVPKPSNWASNYDLTYDAWNRLTKVMDGTATIATYDYDGLNRRVRKVTSTETRDFYYNIDWQCLEEQVNNTLNTQYVWGLRYVDDLVCVTLNGTMFYVLQDANWNVVALLNGSTVVERYTYNAFGKRQIYDTNFNPRTTSNYPTFTRAFTGQVLDNETGLMLYRNRMYHNTLGRFVQRDPIGYDADDVNFYRYVYNDVISDVDTYGLEDSNPETVRTIPDWLEEFYRLNESCLKDNPGAKAWIERRAALGCVGFTIVALGWDLNGLPDLRHCYETYEEAEKIKNTSKCSRGTPTVFGIHFYTTKIEGYPKKSDGTIDMQKFIPFEKNNGCNFDFGIVHGDGKLITYGDGYYNPKGEDGRGKYFPHKDIVENAHAITCLRPDWPEYRGSFNRGAWCVSCAVRDYKSY